ncbi:MAG: beta-ketoacyl-[acyl-carrier-protein] synthase family protein [Acidobacteria bacterium]|nr:MAG: beta-ketoacyl-[acyl-carrier-protein] synthase family protein [Acidobacteriota bacterium]REJ97965.1 MAG: beta-ketoacyl-[acyl-carrier-protein] synthase family protein [Acidobacteriota bacterium]REK16708.1 MAG: beta-ketoacyl-[acyl-carrier-protein] synthase family protein [Acidobacteriota bacterium]REK42619.1 MAG: beta-ketoacyl-[acyl-carrier-protein] synthase family protein [Acidobacteriota bacterium]
MFNDLKPPRKVVITGFGCVTPIGIGKDAFWKGLSEGRSGVRRIESFDVSDSAVQIAAEIPEFDWKAQLNPKDFKHVSRTVPLALAAAREAVADSGIEPEEFSIEQKQSFGVVLGTGGGGLEFTEKQYAHWFGGTEKQASIYTIPSSTHGGLSSELSMVFGLKGLSHIVSTGCTSSTDAISYAAQHIALGKQDVMLAGGVDSPIARGILEAFNVMTVLTKDWNEEPERASRPFSKDRSGIVLGEGSWIYVLETLESARERGAHIYAEIAGYGATCDAYHRVRLDEDAVEPARAMKLAMNDAGIAPEEVDYVNLHGTSTQLNDRIETRAIRNAFNSHSESLKMSATKSQVGHPQGASGAAGIGAALLALSEGTIAPTINLDIPDEECDLDYTPIEAAKGARIDTALCNCIGFGSKNSALVLRSV